VARVLLYCGLFVGVGGAFFCSWMVFESTLWPAGRTIKAALVLGLSSAILSLPLQGADVLGTDLSFVGVRQLFAAGAASTFGLSLAIGATAMSLSFAAGKQRNIGVARVLTVIGLLGVGIALAVSGHASDAPPHWLMSSAVFFHAICIAFWIGTLVPLRACLRSDPTGGAQPLVRFSLVIPVPLALLLSAGFVLGAVQIEHVSAFWTTTYGRILALQLLLVLFLVMLGAWNRWRLADQVTVERSSRRSMLQSIATECVLAAAILGLVASWRFTPRRGLWPPSSRRRGRRTFISTATKQWLT
jgi:copper transport protein